ncbi:MAG: hypothetical protein H0Z33_01675 [Bacillaceae bacterium]|nr:hypothetical protein [Bacillaceae bacterium]
MNPSKTNENVKTDFWTFLKQVRDEISEVEKGLQFIDEVMRRNDDTPPPIVEMVTVLKNEKPVLFQSMKQRIQFQTNLKMIFELDMDYQTARERLL